MFVEFYSYKNVTELKPPSVYLYIVLKMLGTVIVFS